MISDEDNVTVRWIDASVKTAVAICIFFLGRYCDSKDFFKYELNERTDSEMTRVTATTRTTTQSQSQSNIPIATAVRMDRMEDDEILNPLSKQV